MTGIELIAAERQRQIDVEGWTLASDSRYEDGELAMAATCYAATNDLKILRQPSKIPMYWPWNAKWWKPTPDDRIRELQKAGALIAAEIDRLQDVIKHTMINQ